jgi:hypothetical protein
MGRPVWTNGPAQWSTTPDPEIPRRSASGSESGKARHSQPSSRASRASRSESRPASTGARPRATERRATSSPE